MKDATGRNLKRETSSTVKSSSTTAAAGFYAEARRHVLVHLAGISSRRRAERGAVYFSKCSVRREAVSCVEVPAALSEHLAYEPTEPGISETKHKQYT